MYSIPMSIFDFIPGIFFLLGSICIFKYVNKYCKKYVSYIFAFGVVLSFFAGTFKALYKLLVATGIGQFKWMSNQFFTNQSFGFLICGIAILICAINTKKTYGILPTMALVSMMVLGIGLLDFSLLSISKKENVKGNTILYIISFVCCLCMGYLSSKDFTQNYMNWSAEVINVVGQGLYFIASRKLLKKKEEK